jgi:hypothetical protein
MIAYEDCVAFCDLTEDEIAAIAEHESIPPMAAAALGSNLVRSPEGMPVLKRFIVEDIENALAVRDRRHAAELKRVLENFCQCHPEVGAA